MNLLFLNEVLNYSAKIIYNCDVQPESYIGNDGCMCKLVLPKSKYYIYGHPFPDEYKITPKILLMIMPWHVKMIRKLLKIIT